MPNVIRDLIENAHGLQEHPLLIVATANSIDSISGHLRGLFRHEIAVQAPSEKQRLDYLEDFLGSVPCSSSVSIEKIAKLTASFTRTDLAELVNRASVLAVQRMKGSKYLHTYSFDLIPL